MKILNIMLKNFKLLIRSRTSALIIVLGPLLIIALVGLAFSNTSLYAINIGVYSSSYNELSESLIDKLSENQFRVDRKTSQESCINDVKIGDSNICMIIPGNLDVKSEGMDNTIDFYVDYSKINIVWMVIETISEKISAETAEISKGLAADLIDKIDYAQSEIHSELSAIAELSNENKELEERITKISQKMSSLNLEVNKDEFVFDEIKTRATDLKDKAEEAVDRANELINDIQSDMGDWNLSSGAEDALEDILDEAEEDIAAIEDDLDVALSGNTSTSFTALLDDVDSKLDQTIDKLDKAAEAKTSVGSEASEGKDILADSLSKLNNVQASMNNIVERIESLEVKSAEKIASPITTSIKSVTTKKTHFNFLFPTLIVLIIMITSVLLASTLVMSEKKSRSFFRNSITPTGDITFNIATYLTALIIMILQLAIFLVIAAYFFKTDILSSIGTNILILFLVTSLFIYLGMLVGSIFRSSETNTLAAITLSCIFLFFSSTVLPLESMPAVFKSLANFNPFVVSEALLKQSLFFKFSFKIMKIEFIKLICSIAVAFLLTFGAVKLSKLNLFRKLGLLRIMKKKKKEQKLKEETRKEVREENKEEKKEEEKKEEKK